MKLALACSVVAMLLLGVVSLGAAKPYQFGRLGTRLTSEELSAIAAATGAETWAVLGWYSQVLPEVRYVDAFLQPTVSTEKLRRGSIAHLQCRPLSDKAACLDWTKTQELGAYVQVVAGPRTIGAGPAVRSESERPIRVMGRFSDADLLGLVAYIRSGPGPRYPRGVFGMTVSTDVPIQDIEQQPDGSVWVRLTGDGVSGETAIVIRARRGWRIREVVGWVS
jgi:hypothetical protein